MTLSSSSGRQRCARQGAGPRGALRHLLPVHAPDQRGRIGGGLKGRTSGAASAQTPAPLRRSAAKSRKRGFYYPAAEPWVRRAQAAPAKAVPGPMLGQPFPR